MDPVWGGLAGLMGGAAQSDGFGGWTLPEFRRWRPPARASDDASPRSRRRVVTAAEREEGRRLAVAVAREVHRALLELEAEQPAPRRRRRRLTEAEQRRMTEKRLATAKANGSRFGKPVGKHLAKITEDLIREAHELYWAGSENGKPLSLRRVAAIVLPRTGYSSVQSCANCLHEAWQTRGWPTGRDRVQATRIATVTHGELVGTKDWRDPVARERKNEYRRRRRRQDPSYAR